MMREDDLFVLWMSRMKKKYEETRSVICVKVEQIIKEVQMNTYKIWRGHIFDIDRWNYWIIGLLAAIIVDILCKICHRVLKCFLSYEIGVLVAILVVAWTFTGTLIIYLVERAETRSYGIRMQDYLLSIMKKNLAIRILCIVILIMLLMIISVIVQWKITLVVLSGLQFKVMVAVFWVFCILNNRNNLRERMAQELEEGLKKFNPVRDNGKFNAGLLSQMIQRMDYEKDDSLNQLHEVLKDTVTTTFVKYMKQEERPELEKSEFAGCISTRKEAVIYASRMLAGDILQIESKRDDIAIIVQNWFKEQNTTFEIKQGILMAFTDRITPCTYWILRELLAGEERDWELRIWVWLYNLKLQGDFNQEWRHIYSDYFACLVSFREEIRYIKKAMEYWRMLQGKNANYENVLRYIFSKSA